MRTMQVQLAAAHIVKQVIDNQLSLDHGLKQYIPLVAENRAQLQEISYGTCRFYVYFDAILGHLLKKPIKQKDRIIHFVLICAFYQLDHMRTPDHAVVNQSVKALEKRSQSWAKNLVNGVLRNYIRQGEQVKALITDFSKQTAFPGFWLDQFRQSWPDYYMRIMSETNHKPPMTLRVNLLQSSRIDYVNTLEESGIDFAPTSQSDYGVQLLNPMPVENLPGFGDGRVSVQDESAQLVAPLMKLKSGQRVLDGCAAPGGKTCAMLELEPGLKSMTAIDLEKRIAGINENLQRLNLKAEVVCADLGEPDHWWDGGKFDRILLDVPCSGSGVIRRHPDIKHRRIAGDFEKFAEKQFRLLKAAWTTLIPGGLLLYVTCSVINLENDGVIARFVGEYNDAQVDLLENCVGIETKYGKQRLPGIHSGDGFYFCRIKKLSD